MNYSHDRLQQECYLHLHNSYPHLRKTFWAVINEVKPVKGETKQQTIIRANYLKSIGLVPGVLDFHWYYKGQMYFFDFKVGSDRLSDDQKHFIAQVKSEGGICYEINTLDQFVQIVAAIISGNSLPSNI